jgi:hypothetical protein
MGGSSPRLVLLYDFQGVEGSSVPDGSGHGHTGTLEAGEIVPGRQKPAVRLTGRGRVSTPVGLDLASRALTVGAMCRPAAPDGVIASLGDATEGFSLYLQGGVPHFALKTRGVLHQVASPDPVELDQWVHVAGVVTASGELELLVNAFPVARADGSVLFRAPDGPFTVGAGAALSDREAPAAWQGLLQDVRLYQGALSRDADRDLLAEWAARPGCGCRK